MAPIIGKLICNNRDALQQRDEDTATMMEMIGRKRNDRTFDSEDINNHNKADHQEEILEIAEAIRELAVKLQTRRERCSATESNPQLNASLTRSLEHIQKSIIHTPKHGNKKNDIQQSLLDAYSRLQSSQDDDWLIDIVTPKAGNLSLLEEKTPLHSNISRNQTKTSKDRLASYNAMHRNPYPLTSKKPVPKIDTVQPRYSIDDSLTTLRNELSKAKTVESHSDDSSLPKKKHPFSARNQRSISRSRNESERSSSPKERHTNLIIDVTTKSLGKIRSLSTGRAAQHGKQMINRILRRETPDDNTDEKTLTATSSDSTHESHPLSRREKGAAAFSDAKLDLVAQQHRNYVLKAVEKDGGLDQRQNESNRIFRRSGTPKNQAVEQHTANQQRQSRSTTPFRSLQPSQPRQPMTIDASMSNISMTSGYIASNTDHCPMKYRTVRNNSAKGFEIFMPDGGSTAKTHIKTEQSDRCSLDKQSRTRDSIDRVAISQRLQQHQKSIKEKMRKDLIVTTDLRDNHDTVPDKLSKANTTKSTSTNIDSTRAIILRHDKIMNDNSVSSIHSSTTSMGDANSTIAVKKRTSYATQTKPRRTIIRE
jgi:hypothetical protein